MFVNWVQGLGFGEDEDEGEVFEWEGEDLRTDFGAGEGFCREVGYGVLGGDGVEERARGETAED